MVLINIKQHQISYLINGMLIYLEGVFLEQIKLTVSFYMAITMMGIQHKQNSIQLYKCQYPQMKFCFQQEHNWLKSKSSSTPRIIGQAYQFILKRMNVLVDQILKKFLDVLKIVEQYLKHQYQRWMNIQQIILQHQIFEYLSKQTLCLKVWFYSITLLLFQL